MLNTIILPAGLQYSLGLSNNSRQLVNVSNPVEFNFTEMAAFQGTRTNTVKSVYNSFTLLLAAWFNFNGEQSKNQ